MKVVIFAFGCGADRRGRTRANCCAHDNGLAAQRPLAHGDPRPKTDAVPLHRRGDRKRTMTTKAVREVATLATAHRQREGAGFIVRRPISPHASRAADPFLMLDELGPVDYAPGEAIGAPDHPHRGFETVTYILEGEGAHADSAGHRGVIGPGDVQWMTAGRGVIHSEMPSAKLQKEGGRMHGFQLWVNLPAVDKMMAPRYQEIPRARIPQAQTADGLAQVRVVAGEALGARAVIETRTPIAYHDWTLRPGAAVDVSLERSNA